MDCLKRMNYVIDYIENNLVDEINYEEMAKVACCSTYHLQRMFSFLTDVTLSEYIRNRRLSLAAFELQNSNIKIIDLALKYGYESPSSFSRAFQNLHGGTPSSAREMGVELKAYPRMSFYISIEGGAEMDYKIIKKDSFSVIGKKLRVTTVDEKNLRIIPQFWDECKEDGTSDDLCEINDVKGDRQLIRSVLGICADCPEPEKFDYWIGVEKPNDIKKTLKEGFEELKIPKETWAVFSAKGPISETIQKLWKRIYSEFFTESVYEHSGGADFELYQYGDVNNQDYCIEIWVPVKKTND